MWPWRTAVAFDAEGVKVGAEHLAFSDLTDASFDGTTLVLTMASGLEHRARVRGGLLLLERILDGIAAAHPRTSMVYRTASVAGCVDPASGGPRPAHRPLRRLSLLGSPDLWLGRTLYR